jgi:hypothetical protein
MEGVAELEEIVNRTECQGYMRIDVNPPSCAVCTTPAPMSKPSLLGIPGEKGASGFGSVAGEALPAIGLRLQGRCTATGVSIGVDRFAACQGVPQLHRR